MQDVVLLQEVFVKADAVMLAAAAAQGPLKHSQYFPSGYLGGELLILSRWPIQYIRSAPGMRMRLGMHAHTAPPAGPEAAGSGSLQCCVLSQRMAHAGTTPTARAAPRFASGKATSTQPRGSRWPAWQRRQGSCTCTPPTSVPTMRTPMSQHRPRLPQVRILCFGAA